MTLALTLSEPTVEVLAGRSTSVVVQVLNDGPEAQHVRLELTGRAAPWMQLAGGSDGSDDDWQVVQPGQTLTAPLVVSPPRGAAVPGQLVPFSVRARSRAASRPAAVTTGIVLFSAPVPVTAALLPASARAAGASQHVVEMTTDDAAGVLVTLHGTTGAAATVTVDPVAVRVQPGSPARADVVVRPRRPALWGTRRHSFEVVWETDVADGLARGTVPGRLEQRPVLPRPVTVLLLLGVLGVLGLGVAQLWPSDDQRGEQCPEPRSGDRNARLAAPPRW